MKITALIGLVCFAIFIVLILAIVRKTPQSPFRLSLIGTLALIGAFVTIAWLMKQWLDSIPWLPRHP